MARLKLNNITKIVVQFSPYRPGSASARYGKRVGHANGRRQQALRLLPGTVSVASVTARSFLATVLTDKVRATNPKCEITPVLTNGDVPPQVEIVYSTWGCKLCDGAARTMLTQAAIPFRGRTSHSGRPEAAHVDGDPEGQRDDGRNLVQQQPVPGDGRSQPLNALYKLFPTLIPVQFIRAGRTLHARPGPQGRVGSQVGS